MDRAHLLSQGIAVFCIVFGTAACGFACIHGGSMEALKTLGAGIAGAGIQAFTSQIRAAVNKGTVNVTPEPQAS